MTTAQLWIYLQPGLDGYSLRSLAGILLKMVWKSAQPVRLCWGQNSCYFMVICKYLLPPTKYGAVSGWTSWWWLLIKFKTSDLTRSPKLKTDFQCTWSVHVYDICMESPFIMASYWKNVFFYFGKSVFSSFIPSVCLLNSRLSYSKEIG